MRFFQMGDDEPDNADDEDQFDYGKEPIED